MNWKKGMKWIVAVFAVLVLMSAFVGAVSAEGEVGTPDITLPTGPIYVNEEATFSFTATNATSYSVSFDSNTPAPITSTSTSQTFTTVGQHTISVTASDGTNNSQPKDETFTVFGKITEVPISIAVNKGSTRPSSADTTNANVAVTWENADGSTFEAGKSYTATFTITPKENYKFSENPTVTVNGAAPDSSSKSDNSITVTKPFSIPADMVAEKTKINSVTLTVSSAPVGGAAVPTISVSDSTNLTISSTVWKKGTSTVTSNLEYNADYSVTVEISIATGKTTTHEFADTVSVIKPSSATSQSSVSRDSASKITVTLGFKTAAAPTTQIKGFDISVSSAPTGNSAAPTISLSGSTAQFLNMSTPVWNPALSNSKFEFDKVYSASFDVTIKNPSAQIFDNTVTVSNKPTGASALPTVVRESNSKVKVTITFNKTVADQKINSVSLTVDAPVLGAKPDTTVTTDSSANYEVSSITWYETTVKSGNEFNVSETFEQETVYAAEIKLTAKSGYVFNSSMAKSSAKVNNKAVSSDLTFSDSNKKLTLQYTFSKTGEAQKPVITLTAEPANPVIKSGLDSVAVKFTYKITGDFDSASLNFGDNSEVSITQSGGTESHTYTSASTFTVTMRAGNENGTTTKTLSLPITKEQFKASFDASLLSGEAPLKVLFTDTSTGTSGKLIQRSWDFDDGTTAAAQTSVTHTFEKEGTYYVRLFISDGVNQHTATKTITVTKKGGDDKVKIDVDYEPFIIIGDVGVPSPFDLIAEFVRLIQAMLNFDNYTIFSGENAES